MKKTLIPVKIDELETLLRWGNGKRDEEAIAVLNTLITYYHLGGGKKWRELDPMNGTKKNGFDNKKRVRGDY